MCIAAIATIASTVVGVAGAISQGNAAQAAADAQAAALQQQAEAERKAAGFEQAQTFRKQQLEQSAARAAVGASGVAITGSPTEALIANVGQNQLDLQAIQFGSTIKQNNLRTQADIATMQGKQAKTASFINAGGSLFSGISSLYDQKRSVKMGMNPFQ
jgi:hypothetical protein